jgi:valyl-tRNA synthetase
MAKQYDPSELEDRIYKQWEEAGLFHAEVDPAKKPYTIMIPPPNVTGVLHMGHGLNNTIQDILIRYHKMLGYNTLWMPGTDHAGIATQNVGERKLATEGKSGATWAARPCQGDDMEVEEEQGLHPSSASCAHWAPPCDWERGALYHGRRGSRRPCIE